jgi:hypothetical protein
MYNPLTMPRRAWVTATSDVKKRVGSRKDLRDHVAKTARVVFQVSPAEKREIQETASGFGMTTTEYLLQVHRLFRKLSGGKTTPKSVVKGRTDLN